MNAQIFLSSLWMFLMERQIDKERSPSVQLALNINVATMILDDLMRDR